MPQSFHHSREELEDFLDFMEEDLENVRRALRDLEDHGVEAKFIVHGKSETVEESVEKKGVDAKRIIKTLVFMAEGEPVAVLCPGDTSVSEEKLESITGSEVRMAKPAEVKEHTGYRVGGVSPFDLDIPVYMEESILEVEIVNPAAGSRVVGAELDPEDLKDLTGAEVVDVGR